MAARRKTAQDRRSPRATKDTPAPTVARQKAANAAEDTVWALASLTGRLIWAHEAAERTAKAVFREEVRILIDEMFRLAESISKRMAEDGRIG